MIQYRSESLLTCSRFTYRKKKDDKYCYKRERPETPEKEERSTKKRPNQVGSSDNAASCVFSSSSQPRRALSRSRLPWSLSFAANATVPKSSTVFQICELQTWTHQFWRGRSSFSVEHVVAVNAEFTPHNISMSNAYEVTCPTIACTVYVGLTPMKGISKA